MVIEEEIERVAKFGRWLDVLEPYGVRRDHEGFYPYISGKYCVEMRILRSRCSS